MGEPITVKPDPREGQRVDLGGGVFTLRVLTRSVRAARDKYTSEVGELPDVPAVVARIGVLLDAILEPEQGKRKKPSAYLAEKYDADEWTEDQILDLLTAVFAAQDAEDPT